MQLAEQLTGPAKPQPVAVLFDCAMGDRADDPLALALLYGLDGKNEARVVSITVSKSNLKSAALCEAIGRFYSGAVSGAFNAVGRTLPIGMSTAGISKQDTPMLTGTLSRLTPEGKPLYQHGIFELEDTADPVAVLRNALTAQPEQNVVVVMTGPATNLARLLALGGIKPLIAAKVRALVIASGARPNAIDSVLAADFSSATKVLAEWPTPIFFAGDESNEGLLIPHSEIESAFAWSVAHPVADAHRAVQAVPRDEPTGAMAAVMYAVRPQADYFKASEAGTLSLSKEGRIGFAVSTNGKHRYIVLDMAQKEAALQSYLQIAGAKPVIRQPRGPRPVVAEAPPALKP